MQRMRLVSLIPETGAVEEVCLVLEFVTPYLPKSSSEADVERHSLLATGNAAAAEEKKGKTVKAALYGLQVFYSFFIM